MKAVCWRGKKRVRVEDVPEPRVVSQRDAVVQVALTAICGSDVHLYDGYIPSMRRGDILGHEFMGTVVDVGSEVQSLKPGDRVVVPFTIACGQCFFCQRGEHSLCDNSNPGAWMAKALYGHAPAGIYGYSHMLGGFAGGQAEYVRVPFADIGPIKIPDAVTDEQALFLSDIFPTGYQAADVCSIGAGDVVAVWGCGPVGQFAIRSALLLGADRVIAIDRHDARLDMARRAGRVEAVRFDETDVYEAIMDLTAGRGADACIDAVGLEAHGSSVDAIYDRVKVATFTATDRVHVLRQALRCCRKGGTLSVPGVYGGLADKFPIGVIFNKAITIKAGQTHVQRYLRPLLERIENDEIDPSFVVTHRFDLDDAPQAYQTFRDRPDECVKVVMRPAA